MFKVIRKIFVCAKLSVMNYKVMRLRYFNILSAIESYSLLARLKYTQKSTTTRERLRPSDVQRVCIMLKSLYILRKITFQLTTVCLHQKNLCSQCDGHTVCYILTTIFIRRIGAVHVMVTQYTDRYTEAITAAV